MTTRRDSKSGHRERLRMRFRASGGSTVSEAELLELLLSYAIPRRDVAPLAKRLLEVFDTLSRVLGASLEELVKVEGVGEAAATLISLVGHLSGSVQTHHYREADTLEQRQLFDTEPEIGPPPDEGLEPRTPPMRTFVDAETANSLKFLPEATRFDSYKAFAAHLREHLPYNSEATRVRRANYMLNRFFPEERLDVPLAYYAARCATQEDLKPVVFYHELRAEPIAAKVAEGLVWPAVPVGRVEREEMREFVSLHLPHVGRASQSKVLRSLYDTYALLPPGRQDGTTLRFQMHPGTLEAFLYVLSAEFPDPGVYTFEALEQGPMRRWLLWDREWTHSQLYNLRDLDIISKVSEIDRIRQFTLGLDQRECLRHYFEHPQRGKLVLRDERSIPSP